MTPEGQQVINCFEELSAWLRRNSVILQPEAKTEFKLLSERMDRVLSNEHLTKAFPHLVDVFKESDAL